MRICHEKKFLWKNGKKKKQNRAKKPTWWFQKSEKKRGGLAAAQVGPKSTRNQRLGARRNKRMVQHHWGETSQVFMVHPSMLLTVNLKEGLDSEKEQKKQQQKRKNGAEMEKETKIKSLKRSKDFPIAQGTSMGGSKGEKKGLLNGSGKKNLLECIRKIGNNGQGTRDKNHIDKKKKCYVLGEGVSTCPGEKV